MVQSIGLGALPPGFDDGCDTPVQVLEDDTLVVCTRNRMMSKSDGVRAVSLVRAYFVTEGGYDDGT